MPIVKPEQLVALQQNPEGIRNICILAHVDHGKTSLTDALIATNGIISPKLAGKIRYLDSRPDEQLRGITMESSAISLYFSMLRRSAADAEPEQKEYLINLIDSPGHIDFSSEVSTASRLCDGAVVLVDAVEGVCSQTVTVLRQAWVEHMKPILVINKMDRLINELKFTPLEAYIHLRTLLEQVNAVLGSFFQGERMEEDLNWRERVDERVAAAAAKEQERADKETNGVNSISMDTESMASNTNDFEEKDDEDIYFAPERNNVIFSSAIDGWAFTVRQFASLYEKKLGIKRTAMEKVLWGEFYLDTKTKKVLAAKHLKGRNLKPMFVQLVLEQIWNVYEATTGGDNGMGDPAMRDKITKSLNIKLQPHVLRSKDTKVVLTTIFGQWLPLSTALLVSVIESLPSPPVAQEGRLPALIDASPGADHVDPRLRDAMIKSKTTMEDPVVVYVSKMVSIPESELPQNKRRTGAMTGEEAREIGRRKREEIAKARALEDAVTEGLESVNGITNALESATIDDNTEEEQHDPEHLIGFARIFCGTLKVGDSVYVIPPKFSAAHPHHDPEPVKITVTALYLLMGRSLEPLDSVQAGVIFGIGGLEGHILKSGTLSSQLEGSVNLAGVNMGSRPIVRVALEPVNPADLDKMIKGLRLLVQSDPCAEYEQFESGEHVLLTAGELHLERCLTDLRERFARCEIQAGEAIVPYRETLVRAEEMKPPANKELGRGTVIAITTSKQVTIKLRVLPLPAEVTEFLSKNSGAIKRLYSDRLAEEKGKKSAAIDGAPEQDDEDVEIVGSTKVLSLEEFKSQLQATFKEIKGQKDVWINAVDQITAFGPRRTGQNILIDNTKDGICGRFLRDTSTEETHQSISDTLQPRDFADKISYAFQIATAQGPLCNEPVQGMAVFLEEVVINQSTEEDAFTRDKLGRLTGEVIKSMQQGIKDGFLDWSPRLLLAMYSCEVQSSTEALGRVYDVLTRRRGRVLSESMKEGTPFYSILSLLPVAESFGFAEEIRKRTSGAAAPQLIFQGYEILDEDPFWVPFTEDDLEDLGELADKENVAKRYMDKVRMRKGLMVSGKKLVKDAEKQKTLKR